MEHLLIFSTRTCLESVLFFFKRLKIVVQKYPILFIGRESLCIHNRKAGVLKSRELGEGVRSQHSMVYNTSIQDLFILADYDVDR